jgi:hypothetical protein
MLATALIECRPQEPAATATGKQESEGNASGKYRRPELVALGPCTSLLQGKDYGVWGDYAGWYYTRIG